MYSRISSIIVSALYMLSIFGQVRFASADDIVTRFIFNNGNPSVGSTYCSPAEHLIINQFFPKDMQLPSRHLRSGVEDEIVPESSDRELYPLFCADACEGYATGTCRVTRCVGYRRERERSLQSKATVEETCNRIVSELHARVDALILTNLVSKTCKSFLMKSERNVYCNQCGSGL
jgi:hypothetical protein